MRATMLLIGLAMLLPWSSTLNLLGLLEEAFVGSSRASTYAGAFSTTYLVSNFAVLAVERARERNGALLGEPSRIVVLAGSMTALVTLVLALVVATTYDRATALYYLVGLCLLALGGFTASLQSGTFRFSAKHDVSGKTTQAIMAGQAVAGLLSSIVIFLLVPGGFQPARVGSIYLIITAAVVAASIAQFARLLKRDAPYGQVPHATNSDAEEDPPPSADDTARPTRSVFEVELHSNRTEEASAPELIKATPPWRHASLCALAVFLCFTCTLGVFPGVTVHLRPESISKPYFQPLLVLAFNIGDLLGRLVGPWSCLSRPLMQCFYGLLRFAFVPLIISCGMDGSSHVPQAFFGDVWPLFWITLLGLTNGHLATIAMMIGCERFSPTAMSLWLNAGLAAGSILSTLIAAAIFDD